MLLTLSSERPIDALEAEEAGTERADHDFAWMLRYLTIYVCRSILCWFAIVV